MSTNSMIGILNDDNKTVTAIYCHWDGYISNNGYLLSAFWKDKKKAESLIKVGSISGLGTMLPVRDGLVTEWQIEQVLFLLTLVCILQD